MAVTIRDVAAEAQVSPSTVSRVFNHDHLVKKTTRERVQAAADALGYAPNAAARSLIKGRTQSIGVVVPAPHGEFFSELIRGLDEAAQAAEHHLLISSSRYSTEEGKAALDALAGRVDGLVVMAPRTKAAAWAKWLQPDAPVVFLNTDVEGVPCDTFSIENRAGAARIVRHLIEQGYRRIGAITGPPGTYDVEERLAGYRTVLDEHGLSPGLILEGAFTQKSGYEAGQRLAALPERPEAIFACNDYMALGAVAALQEAGLHVPRDVAVAGFDDVPSACYAHPPLTTAHVPAHTLGVRAAEQLFERLRAGEGPAEQTERPQVHVLPCALKVRASTMRE